MRSDKVLFTEKAKTSEDESTGIKLQYVTVLVKRDHFAVKVKF